MSMNLLETRHGKFLVRTGDDFITMNLCQKGEYEWHVVELVGRLVASAKSGVVLDIGANIGTLTVPIAASFPHLVVHAYEPQPSVMRHLQANCLINELENVQFFDYGLGAEANEVFLTLPDYKTDQNVGAFSMHPHVLEFSHEAQKTGKEEALLICTLDEDFQYFTDSNVVCIKMDVEGMELDVLKGGEKFLKFQNYPPLVYENWRGVDWWKEKEKELDDYVESLGYELHQIGVTTIALHKEGKKRIQATRKGTSTEYRIYDAV